jgi:hypothetical protein
MQHVITIAFDFDDDKVRKIAEKAVSDDMDTIIKNIILDRIAPETYKWNSINKDKERDYSRLESKVDNAVSAFLEENRDKIIETAADKLTRSIRSTKAWKEARNEANPIYEGVKKND